MQPPSGPFARRLVAAWHREYQGRQSVAVRGSSYNPSWHSGGAQVLTSLRRGGCKGPNLTGARALGRGCREPWHTSGAPTGQRSAARGLEAAAGPGSCSTTAARGGESAWQQDLPWGLPLMARPSPARSHPDSPAPGQDTASLPPRRAHTQTPSAPRPLGHHPKGGNMLINPAALWL